MDGTAGGTIDWVAHIPVILTMLVFASGIAWAIIELRSRRLFIAREDLAERFTGFANLFAINREAIDTLRERLARIEEADRLRWVPVADALSKLGDQVERLQLQLPAVVARLEGIAQRLDALDRHQGRGRDRD